jgi:Transcriptional regulator
LLGRAAVPAVHVGWRCAPWGVLGVERAWEEQRRWAGHSKWSKIKHTKAANDAKKTLMFSKVATAIIAAVRGTSKPHPFAAIPIRTSTSPPSPRTPSHALPAHSPHPSSLSQRAGRI